MKKGHRLTDGSFLFIYISTFLLYLVAIGLQGIDLTDEGLICTGFQQIYEAPSTISAIFSYYDTLLVGGVIHLLFPGAGIIAFRITSALCLTLVACIVFYILRNQVNRWLILLGVFIATISKHYISVLHYNYTSALLAVIIAMFIYKACTSRRALYMFVAGIFVGISVFFRIPNICLCGMIIVLIPFYIYSKSTKQTIEFLCYAMIGMLIGIIINVCAILLLHHQEPFLEMLEIIATFLTKHDSTHNAFGMLYTYKVHIYSLIKYISIFLAIPLADFFAWNKIRDKRLRTIVRLILMAIFIWKLREPWHDVIILLYAFCSICLLYNILSQPQNKDSVYLSVIGLTIMILLPLGSDFGLYNVNGCALYIALPLSIGIMFQNEHSVHANDLYESVYKKYATVFLIYTIAITLSATASDTFRDSGPRIEKTARPKLTATATTFTTPARAELLDTLFMHITPLTNDETYLLAYPSIPAINYLSNTKPYLSQPFVGGMDYTTYKIIFERSRQSKPLPIIVISKAEDMRWDRKNENWHCILDCRDWHPSIEEKNKYLMDFVTEHNYVITWENDLFQILTPPTHTMKKDR